MRSSPYSHHHHHLSISVSIQDPASALSQTTSRYCSIADIFYLHIERFISTIYSHTLELSSIIPLSKHLQLNHRSHDTTMSSYKLSLFTSFKSATPHGLEETPTPFSYRVQAITAYTNTDGASLALPPIQHLYGATPTSYSGSGVPVANATWWNCCRCKNMVNPDLAPEDRCPICEHTKCVDCRAVVV